MREVLRGDSRAFTDIVDRYTAPLYTLALRMLGDREGSEEAVQEIFLKAYRALPRFQLTRRFHPWMYTIAVNHLRTELRRRSVRRRRSAEAAVERLPSREQGPSELTLRREGERLAEEALLSLRPEYRSVFVLRQVEGLPVSEVAEILGLPEGTVKTRLHRARAELARELARQGFDEG